MKRSYKQASLIGCLILAPLTFNQCGKVSFDQANAGAQSLSSSLPTGPVQTFKTSAVGNVTATKPIDLIFVVDNSGSMADSAKIVRDNILAFANTISNQADVQIALLSSLGTTSTNVTLPPMNIPSLSINQVVASTNGLSLLTDALAIGTPLRRFLRADSQKILVMVTDDNSKLAYTNFLNFFESIYGAGKLTSYGFIGLGLPMSPCQARTGDAYLKMNSVTGGESFNICDADWSPHFSKLAANVIEISLGNIPLPQAILDGKIVSVKVNGVVLTSADYQISAAGILLVDPLHQLHSVDLEIQYF